MIFSISSSFSVKKTGVLEKSTDFATVYVSYGYSPYYSPGLGYGAGQIFPNGDCSFSIGIYADSYGKYTPDTYMGGSEGVMQVTDYGEIQFETWLHVSYGFAVREFWRN